MTVVFDGNKIASGILNKLTSHVDLLKNKGITPKLVSIVVVDNKKSMLYPKLKKKAANKVGIEFKIIKLAKDISKNQIKEEIEKLNVNNKVHGIIVQLPMPSNYSKKDTKEIINTIEPEKDVDGLRDDSPYITPVVKAVLESINHSPIDNLNSSKTLVVGVKGFFGNKIYKNLKNLNYKVTGVDLDEKNLNKKTKKADILISATGTPKLIKESMIKKGAVVIDVGYPKGDVDFDKVSKKTSFITPVPGGIGPVAILYLLENLIYSID